MDTQEFPQEYGYGNDFTPETIDDLYQAIEVRRKKGLPLFGVALLIEDKEGKQYSNRIGLRVTHQGEVLEHEHTEYEE